MNRCTCGWTVLHKQVNQRGAKFNKFGAKLSKQLVFIRLIKHSYFFVTRCVYAV